MSYLRHEVHAPLPLLLLQLERNSGHGPPLDALHQVGDKACDLVTHTLRRNDRDLIAHTLVRVEVQGQTRVVLLDDGSRRLLHCLRADTLHKGNDQGSKHPSRQTPVEKEEGRVRRLLISKLVWSSVT